MNIALIAHDKRKELMIQFCIAYCGILYKHDICATATTGKFVSDATGLFIECLLSGSQGGKQQIAARASCNEIDLLLFFRDPNAITDQYTEQNIFTLCDKQNIPFATNIATAEMLIQALDRGDLDWRKYVNPIYKQN